MQPLPCLPNLNGELVTTFQQWSEVWRQQFGEQEVGTREPARSYRTFVLPTRSWEQIPTLVDLELSLRQTDSVPGELLHFGAHSLAPALYPLLLKQWLFHGEALLFKGGILVPAYKKGDPTDTNNHRSFLVSPTLAKTFHRLLRGD